MAKKPNKRISLAQNFLRCSKLVRHLLGISSIGPGDTVYEIGPGRGIITAELARIAGKVVAIEADPQLVRKLNEKFRYVTNLEIAENDFLKYHIQDREYKIFANIPYNATAAIVRKILDSSPNPSEAYLVMQKEAAEKFSGLPKETQFSILVKPTWKFQTIHKFRRKDFEPVPNTESVLLHIRKRYPPLIEEKDKTLYRRFVRYGFGMWKKSLKLSFKPIFTYKQWKRLSNDLEFPIKATPTELTLEQWVGLFVCFKERVPNFKQARIMR
jgi:23S rRNA (adenine-N6)-dimethyltransferase